MTAALAAGGVTIQDLHPDVLTRTLRLLDGPALAAASCATSHLRYLSSDPDLWRDLCLSTWPSLGLLPSLPASPRSFFSDAYPTAAAAAAAAAVGDLPSRLISAVDLFHGGVPILSRIVETDASTPWFRTAPFRIDGLDREDRSPPSDPTSPEDLTLSWVVIDPVSGRAVGVTSRRPVAVDRHWYTGETLVRFAAVMGESAVSAVVACGREDGRVREVVLTVEDSDGMCLGGGESLAVIMGAMEGGRSGRGGEEAAARRYGEYVGRRRWRKERKLRREGMVDLFCSAVGVAVFLAFLGLVALR